ncbi:thioesterase [Variovorax boronicumulans]|uniref:Thioesterase n=1 Tax=Variovorax boronicumulans TaxID=436515 RepID=A0A250DNV0_9BURK|nr:alpha/beta fold hydrolase [Variovorax boronicumulans]ATA56046.1 thioesterase [Variovorax boronicumulans]
MSAQAPLALLCLPCAGASASMYLRWRRFLPPWVRIVPVELPGRGARMGETFVEDFDAMVARICAEHADAMRGDFALFGHSMGALLVHGVARRLQSLRRPLPRALLVSGCAAPSRRDPERFDGGEDDASLIAELRKQGGTPEEVFASEELMRITLDMLRADRRVCRSHVHVAAWPPLPLPIHAFAGRQDDIEVPAMAAWSEETGSAFTLDWFEGGHFFLRQHEAAFLAALARRLPTHLHQAQLQAHQG